jgi:hypothetical protein
MIGIVGNSRGTFGLPLAQGCFGAVGSRRDVHAAAGGRSGTTRSAIRRGVAIGRLGQRLRGPRLLQLLTLSGETSSSS